MIMLTEDFIVIDQLCLKSPGDAIAQWTSSGQTDFISRDGISEWHSDREHALEDPSLQRLFLLSTFVKFGKKHQVERLLDRWNYTDQLDKTWTDGKTVLVFASKYGNSNIVALLCRYGVEVNRSDNHGWAALHYAAYYGHPNVAAHLLEHGADRDAKTAMGHTPLTVAGNWTNNANLRRRRAEVKRILRARGR